MGDIKGRMMSEPESMPPSHAQQHAKGTAMTSEAWPPAPNAGFWECGAWHGLCVDKEVSLGKWLVCRERTGGQRGQSSAQPGQDERSGEWSVTGAGKGA